jgi:formamidopyrimidine-DNA glycosylase
VPELPEVETIRMRLAPLLEGRQLAGVRIDDARLTRPNDPTEVASRMRGERVASVDRRGKYLIVWFESGRTLLIHLRMTGTLLHGRDGENGNLPDDPYRRAVISLDNGADVAYRDVRRFGTWLLLEPGELAPYLEVRLGEEPLAAAFTPEALAEGLASRRAPVKAALLDQRTVAGMGNIYADEALWHAEIDPRRPAGSLTPTEVERLHQGIRIALGAGIARQGATLRDYRLPDGESGGMQLEFQVYGRAGEPCLRCESEIAKTRIAGRGSSYCPTCQR